LGTSAQVIATSIYVLTNLVKYFLYFFVRTWPDYDLLGPYTNECMPSFQTQPPPNSPASVLNILYT